MEDKPTILTVEDIENLYQKIINSEIVMPTCSWCENSYYVREVAPNYICPDCEESEKKAGRPLIFAIPVREEYFNH